MKAIFLDIDGVLNCQESKAKVTTEDGASYVGIDKHKIQRLKEIINKTNAKVVLTSTWRKHLYTGDRFDKYLRQRFGKHHIDIFSCVEYKSWQRGMGIKRWLNEHPDVEGWVVLDDEIFSDYDEKIKKHLFLTEFYDKNGGLRDENIETVIAILNDELEMNHENSNWDEKNHVGLEEFDNED